MWIPFLLQCHLEGREGRGTGLRGQRVPGEGEASSSLAKEVNSAAQFLQPLEAAQTWLGHNKSNLSSGDSALGFPWHLSKEGTLYDRSLLKKSFINFIPSPTICICKHRKECPRFEWRNKGKINKTKQPQKTTKKNPPGNKICSESQAPPGKPAEFG